MSLGRRWHTRVVSAALAGLVGLTPLAADAQRARRRPPRPPAAAPAPTTPTPAPTTLDTHGAQGPLGERTVAERAIQLQTSSASDDAATDRALEGSSAVDATLAETFRAREIERLLADREALVITRRTQAISLLEDFIGQEPEDVPEMADALLRLGELRWELARTGYLEAFGAWQAVPPENRGPEPRPDYTPVLALYDRILARHPDFERIDFVLYLEAYALTEIDEVERALAHYRRILTDFPTSRFTADAHFALAETSFANQRFAEALPEFDAVLQHRESDLYDMSLFKSAWCLWHLGRSAEAATRFRQVLDLDGGQALTAAQRQRLLDLQDEALGFLIQVFTEDESNTAEGVFRFLEEIGGAQYADRVLVRLSLTYMEQGRFEQGIAAYRFLLQRQPNDARAWFWQRQIASAQAALGDAPGTLEALTALADGYLAPAPWVAQQSDPAVVAEASREIEEALRVRAMRWHEIAQRDAVNSPQAARRSFENAEAGYALYLAHFGEGEHAYDLRFYRAEILFHRLERKAEAGLEYLGVARQNPTGPYSRDALYNAIGSFELVRDGQLTLCQQQRAQGATTTPAATTPAATPTAASPAAPSASSGAAPGSPASNGSTPSHDTPATPAEDPCGETENDRRFGEAIELYAETYPDDPDLPEILFRQGRLYYDRGIYDPAVRLFGQLLERYPTSTYANTAGELILDSFNRAADFGNIEAWARRLKDAPAFASAESQTRLDGLILQAAFARGEQLASRNEHAEAADAFERAANEFPRDARARQALFNAGLEHQRAGDLAGATADYELLIERYPATTEGALGAWTAAQMYESIAQFRDAARFYEEYGARFPEAERGADAFFNATLLRLSAGDADAAIAAGQRFLERFPRHDGADEVTFFVARAHALAHRTEDAARVYREFIERSRNVDRQVEAQNRLGLLLREAGDAAGAARAFEGAVRTGRAALRRLRPEGRYFLAEARFHQGEALLAEFETVTIVGDVAGLRARLERKSDLLRRASQAFGDVVEFRVAEWVTAALFQIGRSYELFASALRDAPIPEGLTEEEDQAYRDQLGMFIVPIEERALESYEGGYRTALELRIFNRFTGELRSGLGRLNDVEYPPLREIVPGFDDATQLPTPAPLDGLRRTATTPTSN